MLLVGKPSISIRAMAWPWRTVNVITRGYHPDGETPWFPHGFIEPSASSKARCRSWRFTDLAGVAPWCGGIFSCKNTSISVGDFYLVGGIPTPLKNMKVSWDDCSQYMESHKSQVPNHQPVMFATFDWRVIKNPQQLCSQKWMFYPDHRHIKVFFPQHPTTEEYWQSWHHFHSFS